MELSMWSAYFIDLSPEDAVRALAEAEWQVSELSDEHARALLDRGLPSVEGANFARFAAEHGVAFPQGHLWLASDIAHPDPAPVVDELKPWLDLFVTLDIGLAVLHPGGGRMRAEGAIDEEIFDANVRALQMVVDHLDGSNTTICLENIGLAPLAEDLLRIVDAVDSPRLAVCLDTGHLNLADGDQRRFITECGDRLRALHIADNEGQRDQHLAPFGCGTVDWEGVVEGLRDVEFDGPFNYEVPGERRCPIEVRMAKLEYLKRLSAALLGDLLDG